MDDLGPVPRCLVQQQSLSFERGLLCEVAVLMGKAVCCPPSLTQSLYNLLLLNPRTSRKISRVPPPKPEEARLTVGFLKNSYFA